MSKIYELLGFPSDSRRHDVVESRREAICPFSRTECDGGGNRYSSALHLRNHKRLAEHFPGKEIVQAGICSLVVGGTPWIVCPRRLLTMHGSDVLSLQLGIRDELIRYGGLSGSVEYRAWSEVKIKMSGRGQGMRTKSFDYAFDYVVAGCCRKSISEVASIVGKSEQACIRLAENSRFTLAKRDGTTWIEDFPSRPFLIVEIMSASTSGGDRKKRTQVGMAFEDALLKGSDHQGPGINYRQVWARMVSQMIVKSQAAVAWGGKTIWIMQDLLADYISSTTALNLEDYAAECADEVNILAVGYGETPVAEANSGVLPLAKTRFFAGPISSAVESAEPGGFVDIVKAGSVPPIGFLWGALLRKRPCGVLRRSSGMT